MDKFIFLFPGQGSQVPGMGSSFLENPIAKDIFEEANDSLGYDIKKLCLEGPADELTLTQNSQPAILTISTIAHRIFAAQSELKPAFAAGHSLGEFSALVAAGVMRFKDAVKIVHLRGKFMQEAVPVGVGTMAAVMGMSPEDLQNLCDEQAQDECVVIANYNTSGQLVISGHVGAVERVLAKCKKAVKLPVSAPFHSPLMQPAADKLKAELEKIEFSDAAFPIINNAANQFLTKAEDFLPSLFAQVTASVRWQSGIEKAAAEGVTKAVEFGHGKVLAGMQKRIDKSVSVLNVNDMAGLEKTLGELA